MKPYRIIARVKNNRLWAAGCRAFGLDPETASQIELGEKLGLEATKIGHLLNMQLWPAKFLPDGSVEWSEKALNISAAVGEPPEWLFEPRLYSRAPKKRIVVEAGPDLVQVGDGGIKLIEDRTFIEQRIEASGLKPREVDVIRGRAKGLTLEETADDIGITRERVRQLEAKVSRSIKADELRDRYGVRRVWLVGLKRVTAYDYHEYLVVLSESDPPFRENELPYFLMMFSTNNVRAGYKAPGVKV